ncbi:hypothetical protein ACVISU_004231 [Bradyrhizobium sp. USDA 4452]
MSNPRSHTLFRIASTAPLSSPGQWIAGNAGVVILS